MHSPHAHLPGSAQKDTEFGHVGGRMHRYCAYRTGYAQKIEVFVHTINGPKGEAGMNHTLTKDKDYSLWLKELKYKVRLVMAEFPDMKGFSKRNLELIRRWYCFWSAQDEIAKQLATQIPWWHNVVILTKTKNTDEALFYVQKTILNNWSRSVLTHHIESNLFKREGKAITNFKATLPKPPSDLARETLKDVHKPIGVMSEYIITKNLPDEFRSSLPSIEEIEAELSGVDESQ